MKDVERGERAKHLDRAEKLHGLAAVGANGRAVLVHERTDKGDERSGTAAQTPSFNHPWKFHANGGESRCAY
jgi:hypothetical protein